MATKNSSSCHRSMVHRHTPTLHLSRFSAWQPERLEQTRLPALLVDATGQPAVPFGDAVMDLADVTLGFETCEELFCPRPPHIAQQLAGAQIITNGNGSHHEIGKHSDRIKLIESASRHGSDTMLPSLYNGCSTIVHSMVLADTGFLPRILSGAACSSDSALSQSDICHCVFVSA